MRRSDRRKDRVEISAEQLSSASQIAEDMAIAAKRPLRVIGWYHSHPHITVWPSHVDVRTQFMHQCMDQCFVGLIFSCFNEDDAKVIIGDTIGGVIGIMSSNYVNLSIIYRLGREL